MNIIRRNTGSLLAFFLLGMLLLGCAGQAQGSVNVPSNNSGTPSYGTGRVVVVASDAAADMGAVSKIEMTVNNVQLHSSASGSASAGWTTVSSNPVRVDLLQLKAEGSSAVIADAQVSDGVYDQIRMDVSNVVVTDANGTHDAVMPSGHMQIQTQVQVQDGSVSTADVDFVADESLHITGDGKYILAPVVRLETRTDATVQAGSSGRATIMGGRVTSDQTVGMDVDGNIGIGRAIPTSAIVAISSNGRISLGGLLGGSDSAVSIRLMSAPATAAATQAVTVRWSVFSPMRAETPHTSVHFGYTSVPSDPTVAAYAYSTAYLTGTVPAEFSADMTPEFNGTVYYRAHVIVDGTHYWTPEQTMQVGAAGTGGIAGSTGAYDMITGAVNAGAGTSASGSAGGSGSGGY